MGTVILFGKGSPNMPTFHIICVEHVPWTHKYPCTSEHPGAGHHPVCTGHLCPALTAPASVPVRHAHGAEQVR